jgi:hypothetical protein
VQVAATTPLVAPAGRGPGAGPEPARALGLGVVVCCLLRARGPPDVQQDGPAGQLLQVAADPVGFRAVMAPPPIGTFG